MPVVPLPASGAGVGAAAASPPVKAVRARPPAARRPASEAGAGRRTALDVGPAVSLQCAYVGIGANLGDAQATVRRAIEELGQLPRTRRLASSALYRSTPVDAEGPDFINAVVALETELSPEALLKALQQIEDRHHRERPYRHAPRTLDLDLLLVDQQLRDDPALTLPHPRLHLRAFVLVPLLEIAPDVVHPTLGALAPWRVRSAAQGIERLA